MDNLFKKAKQFPITSFYKGQLKRSGKLFIGKCPFHEDSSPSFAIYPQTNTFNCFAGCGGGDVISFYMRLYKVDFKTAIKEMQ